VLLLLLAFVNQERKLEQQISMNNESDQSASVVSQKRNDTPASSGRRERE
jgi:hypothetical protein